MKLSEQMRARIGELVSKRAALHDAQAAILTEAEKRDNKALTADEQRAYDEKRDAKKTLDVEISECEQRLTELVEEEERDARAAESRRKYGNPDATNKPNAQVSEPDMYEKGKRSTSYFRDLATANVFGDNNARDRLVRHAQYMEKRALGNTGATGGSGGEFAPPEWLINEWINIIRAGRVTANLFRHEDIPFGVSSVNYPKLLTGTTTAIQSTQNTALSQTDLTTGFVQAGFATIGGKQVASQQILDQTALNFDQVILNDLAADYALRVGTQVYLGTGTGTGTGAVVNGIQNATFGTTQTWTQASPTPQGFYGQAGATIAAFLTTRLAPPDCWVMHPRRWYWLAAAADTQGRPLVVPVAGNGQAVNPMGVQTGNPVAPVGMVGYFQGLPVYIDPLVPINVGAGTNQDVVYLLKLDDLILFESAPRAEVFRETYADSVGVLFRMYGYVGTILNRLPASLGRITGTGLVTPTFAS